MLFWSNLYRKVIAIVNEMFEKCKAPLFLRPSFILVRVMWHVNSYASGGNAGIGKETAVSMALRGARVIIACRDEEKARKAVREIKARSHNMNVLYMEVDLANMRSIREFSKTFLQKEKRLDILINNAGED